MPTLNFKGKSFVENHHLTIPYHQLIPDEEASLTDKVSLNDNLIIHGDNLIALKALMPNYQGRVKCIYIDPPYNTGNEDWRYNDNVNSPMIQEWLKQNKPIDGEDLTRHDKWLCMMMPRLKLLRDLLQDDGVILVSIDDNEVHHLRMLMDEIFGSENFVATFSWKKRSAKSDVPFGVSQDLEWLICYVKGAGFLAGVAHERKYHKTDDYDDRWRTQDLKTQRTAEERPNSAFDMVDPKTGKKYPFDPNRVWSVTKDTFQEYYDKGKIVFPDDYDFLNPSVPLSRVFENEDKKKSLKRYGTEQAMKALSTQLPSKIIGMTEGGNKEIQQLFGEKAFPYPKPSSLISYFITATTNDNDIILDSFAGSGTTGHAVLRLNEEDETNRQFILIEMEDYANDLTAERIRRVINGVPEAKDESLQKGLDGSFSFFHLGNPIDIQSILSGDEMPPYVELARYLFYVATGEDFDPDKVVETENYIGESAEFHVYLFYQPDLEYLQNTSLNLDMIRQLPDKQGKKRLIFAPTRYVDDEHLEKHHIKFVQLPFEIYRFPSG